VQQYQLMAGTHRLADRRSMIPMPNNGLQRQLLGLVGWLAVSFAAAVLGGFASGDAGEFYQKLARPAWAPPSWLFAPAWTLLYLLMGVAAWLVILWTVVAFWRVRLVAGALLIPYLAWVTFASALTYAVWQRNPTLLAQPFDQADPLRPTASARAA
jgi:tryptophan-rich sensory protein